jgi:predicted DNA-binding transcriptional regulator AlpA
VDTSIDAHADSSKVAAIAPLLPALRKAAGRFGYAFQFCPQRGLHIALQRGRVTLQRCDSAQSARELERGIKTDIWLSVAEVEQLVGAGNELLRDLERRGRFPKRKRVSRKRYAWRALEVEAWIAKREQQTMSRLMPLSTPISPAPDFVPCAGCRAKLQTLKIDDFGGCDRLIVAYKLYNAAHGLSACSGLCSPQKAAHRDRG